VKIINFSHPLTEAQQAQIEALAGIPVSRLIEVQRRFDESQPYAVQTRSLVDAAGLSTREWQIPPLLVNLPSLSVIAGLVLAEIQGRSGHLPAILRLRPVAGAAVPQYEVAEILNLTALRLEAAERAHAGQNAELTGHKIKAQ
jgi:hypothetical protein